MSWCMRGLQKVPWREASLLSAGTGCRWQDREWNADTAGAAASPPSHRGRPWPLPGSSTLCRGQHGIPHGMAPSSQSLLLELLPGKGGVLNKPSGLVMLSADSLGARAEEKAQIPLPNTTFFFFNQKKKERKIIQEFSLDFPC